jgi:hypothetical protein
VLAEVALEPEAALLGDPGGGAVAALAQLKKLAHYQDHGIPAAIRSDVAVMRKLL